MYSFIHSFIHSFMSAFDSASQGFMAIMVSVDRIGPGYPLPVVKATK